MVIASGFSWFSLLHLESMGLPGEPVVMAHTWLVCLVLIGFGLVARMGIQSARAKGGVEQFMPEERLSPRTVAEVIGGFILDTMRSMLHEKDVKTFFGFVGALFTYIFTCNVLGIFPGFLPPTDSFNNNIGMALVVAALYLVVGLTRDPAGYVAHLMGTLTKGPLVLIGLLVFAIETLGVLAIRPGTLTLRLTGNMFGDHTVFTIMSGLFGYFLPVPFLALAIFVSFMQAYVFTLLTTSYIESSVPHADDHH